MPTSARTSLILVLFSSRLTPSMVTEPLVGIFKVVDAAQDGALAGATGADNDHYFTATNAQIDIFRCFDIAKVFVQSFREQ